MKNKPSNDISLLNSTYLLVKSKGVVAALNALHAASPKNSKTKDTDTGLIILTIAWEILRGDPRKAIELAEAAIKINSQHAEALVLLGLAQDQVGERTLARDNLLRAIAISTITPKHLMIAANLLVRLGEGQVALRRGKEAYEQLGRPLNSASALMYIGRRMADWDLVETLIKQLAAAYELDPSIDVDEIPTTHLNWCDNEAINLRVVAAWSKRAIKIPLNPLKPSAQPLAGRKIRIAYLSSDFREHPTSRLVNGLLRHHDHSKFEVFMYCSGWDDGSKMRQEVCMHFDHIYPVADLSDEDAAKLIHSHKIDVLIELNGPTRANRMGILAYRPAPVQIDYLGWPGSVGGRVVDYIVGDAYTIPEGQEKNYPEKVIRLDSTYQVNDFAGKRLPALPTKKMVGLPEGNELIIGMFNAIHKVKNDVWRVWMEILKQVPDALFWVLEPSDSVRDFVLSTTRAMGVDPARIVFAPRLQQNAHLGRLQCCDLTLDPWPYGGHTSTSDALFSGVPVIALEGKNFAGRVSGGLLHAANLPQLVCASKDEYIKTAVALLRDREALTKLKAQIKSTVQSTDIFNARYKTRQFESAYRYALQRFINGEGFVHINMSPKKKELEKAAELRLVTAPITSSKDKVNATKPRVAVVTPYWNESNEMLERCMNSVRAQTFEVTHFVVADGMPQSIAENASLIHIKLPFNTGNCGGAPRGLGAQLAFNMGFDYVAFLDADNWFDPDHIALAVQAFAQQDLDVVFARRRIVFPDGEELKVPDPQEATKSHVDTNCFVISKRVAFLTSVWAMWPKEFGTGEDRAFWATIKYNKLKTAYLEQATVWYLTNWALHYNLAAKTPVAPLRKPERKSGLHFDPERFKQKTGLYIPFDPSPQAIVADKSLTEHPEIWIVKVIDFNQVWLPEVEQAQLMVNQDAHRHILLVGSANSMPLRLTGNIHYLQLPEHGVFDMTALGFAAALGFHAGAGIVVAIPASNMALNKELIDTLLFNLNKTNLDMVVDLRVKNAGQADKTNQPLQQMGALAISMLSASLGFLLAQVPANKALADLFAIYLQAASTKTKKIALLKPK